MTEENPLVSQPVLSILICTIESRRKEFTSLYNFVTAQIQNPNEVEVLFLRDNKEISIGEKRQRLLEMATGSYIVFIDDDDSVSVEYVTKILQAINSNGCSVDKSPDAIGFLIECTFDGKKKCLAKASMKYDWADNVDGYRYVRSIYHKTPVKRELALQAGFPNLRFAEDHEYSRRLKPLVKTENVINKVMYYYNYKTENHKTKYGFDKDVNQNRG